jgi:AcrR family transcriptional regulator
MTEERGLAALSMRRLGAELRADPMAIYHHVPGKAALIRALIEAVFSRMNVRVSPTAPWRNRVEGWARAYRKLIVKYPLVLQIPSDAAAARLSMLAVGEPLYAALGESGLSDPLVAMTADTLVDFVNGFGLAEIGPKGQEARHGLDERFAAGLGVIMQGALALNPGAAISSRSAMQTTKERSSR